MMFTIARSFLTSEASAWLTFRLQINLNDLDVFTSPKFAESIRNARLDGSAMLKSSENKT